MIKKTQLLELAKAQMLETAHEKFEEVLDGYVKIEELLEEGLSKKDLIKELIELREKVGNLLNRISAEVEFKTIGAREKVEIIEDKNLFELVGEIEAVLTILLVIKDSEIIADIMELFFQNSFEKLEEVASEFLKLTLESFKIAELC